MVLICLPTVDRAVTLPRNQEPCVQLATGSRLVGDDASIGSNAGLVRAPRCCCVVEAWFPRKIPSGQHYRARRIGTKRCFVVVFSLACPTAGDACSCSALSGDDSDAGAWDLLPSLCTRKVTSTYGFSGLVTQGQMHGRQQPGVPSIGESCSLLVCGLSVTSIWDTQGRCPADLPLFWLTVRAGHAKVHLRHLRFSCSTRVLQVGPM